jgi:hypothetical protein
VARHPDREAAPGRRTAAAEYDRDVTALCQEPFGKTLVMDIA